MTDRRLILLPRGAPQGEGSRERCFELLLRCGGDLGRVFDGQSRPLDRFARHLRGIGDLAEGREVPLVLLTGTGDIQRDIVAVRATLEAELAVLERAPWLIYADPLANPDCLDALKSAGSLDGPVLGAPLWSGPDGLRYLIVSPLMPAHVQRLLVERVQLASFDSGARSAPRMVTSENVQSRPTLKLAAQGRGAVPFAERPTLPAGMHRARRD